MLFLTLRTSQNGWISGLLAGFREKDSGKPGKGMRIKEEEREGGKGKGKGKVL